MGIEVLQRMIIPQVTLRFRAESTMRARSHSRFVRMEILRSFSAYRFILAIQRIFLLTTPTLSDFFLFRQTAQSAAPY